MPCTPTASTISLDDMVVLLGASHSGRAPQGVRRGQPGQLQAIGFASVDCAPEAEEGGGDFRHDRGFSSTFGRLFRCEYVDDAVPSVISDELGI